MRDHLAVMLEYAAIAGPDAGREILLAHRGGLELLRTALQDRRSPWAQVLDSVCATLPRPGGELRAATAKLARRGPPSEQVGLEPFALQGNIPRALGDPR